MHDLKWSIRVVVEWLAIAGLFYAASLTTSLLAGFVIALLLGTRQHALGIIGHWAMHGLIPRWIMWACFVPIAIDPFTYRVSHTAHHNWLGLPVDPEREVVERYRERWGRLWLRDIVADALFLHIDEMIDIMRLLTSARAVALYIVFVACLYLLIGNLAFLWPLGMGGLLIAHRLRARCEHDHLAQPGVTFRHQKPPLLDRIVYLPHYAWLHAEHHDSPSRKVWDTP